MKKGSPAAAFLCVIALSSCSAHAESFYERPPADIFMGEKQELRVDVVAQSPSGTVRAELSNGMVVLLREDHASPIAMLQVTVRTGSIYEQEYLGTGISHLFEHLMHGVTTTTRTEAETRRILESIGSQTNAYTSMDSTSYFIKVAKGNFDTALGLLADWMMNARVTEEEFNREMSVVQRESERAQASPETVLFRMQNETMFHTHPARYPVIGYDHVRARLSLEDVEHYRARMYVPNNMIVTIVGDVSWAEALEKVRAAFNGFSRGPVPAISLPAEPAQTGPRLASKSLPDLNTTLLAVSYRSVPLTHPDLYPLDVMAAVLGQGESSRLVRAIKHERNLVESISAWSYTPGFDAGEFTIHASIPDANNLQPVRDAVADHLARLRNDLVQPEELERVKNRVAAEHVYQSEGVEPQARSLVSGYLSAGDPDFDARYVAGIQAVTPEQVREAARRYLVDDSLTVAIVEPAKAGEAANEQAKPLQPTAIQKSTLDNGLTLLLKRSPNVPMVAFELYFMAGLRTETEKDNGISNFAAELWSKSTKSRNSQQLAEELDSMGAEISTGTGYNTFFLRATCLSKDLDRMLGIIGDVVANPAFDPEECDKLRTIILSAIKKRDDSIYSQAQHALQEAFYPKGNPYAMDLIGTAEVVGKLTPEQLAQYYRTYARGRGGVLAVFGDIDPARDRAKIANAFAPISSEAPPAIKPIPQARLDASRDVFVARERKEAAAVYFAFPDTTLKDLEDRFAMQVLDVILSGGSYPGGWLHDALRGAGLVYEVHAFNVFGLDPRHFQVQAITHPASVEKVKAIILEKIGLMKQGKFTQEEFKRAKTVSLTEELLSKQTNAQQAQSAAIDELYGLGYDFDSSLTERIDAVTMADVTRVAGKYLTNYVCAIAAPKPAPKVEQPAGTK